ncbi:MAG: ATP-binding protein [Alkalispirochaeta sp.]
MDRVYEALLQEHLETNRQMAVVTGPRQVGKTTSSQTAAGDHAYYTWDRQRDRQLITGGPDAVAEDLKLAVLRERPVSVVFDELHKYRSWRTFLKGYYDVYGDQTRTIVTGSSRLGFFRRSGDSLMGRYFSYRMHPITVGELARSQVTAKTIGTSLIHPPSPIDDDTWDDLYTYGGFPEPFLRGNTRFYNRWSRTKTELLFREDVRDLTRVEEVGQIEVLGKLLEARTGSFLNYSSLANDTNIAVDTARRWTAILGALYHSFTIRPWFRNVPKALRKQPKVYLWDWSGISDPGARFENVIASHLLKATHWWTDIGLGTFELFYLRDKAKREVDFVITRDDEPWFLVETKHSTHRAMSPALSYFQEITGAEHAFQVAKDAPWIDVDCFSQGKPVIVPARTFLSQLV